MTTTASRAPAVAAAVSPPPTVLPTVDEAGAPVFAVLTKRTYDLVPAGEGSRVAVRAERDAPLRAVDEYYDHGDAETSTVRLEADLAPYKVATDVVVIATAHAPQGWWVFDMQAAVDVAGRRKAIRVVGDRRCVYRAGLAPEFTDPEPFTTMPIRYDLAYGGTDAASDPALPFSYPRNHRGRGLAVRNVPKAVDGLALPNFEDPAHPLTPERVVLGEPAAWVDAPMPQGFGWMQRTWYPRCSFVGAVPGLLDPDTVMPEERLGLVPPRQIALARQFRLPSYDVRFNSGASAGMAFPFLTGGELVSLWNLTPDGALHFVLPSDVPRMALDIGAGAQELAPVLHTVCVRVEDAQVDLVWRGALSYPGVDWLPEMRRLVAEVA